MGTSQISHIAQRMCDLDVRTRRRIIMLVSAAVLFYMLIADGPPAYDVINFYEHAEAIKSGMLPYKDFVFEFPPFSLIFFLIPGLFTSDLDTYGLIFGAMVIVFILISLHYLQKICEDIHVNETVASILFIAFFVIYLPIRKFDVFAMCTTLMAIYCFIRQKYCLAYGLAAFATFTKMYPALIVLLFLVMNLMERDDSRFRNAISGVITCVVVTILAIAPLALAGVPVADIMSFVGFHTDRGFHVESIFAICVMTLASIGLTTISIVPAHDTHDVLSPICDMILPYWTLITAIVLITIVAVAIRYMLVSDRKHTDGRAVVMMCMVMIMAFVLINKVFSTQYMTWLFPMMALIPLMTREKGLCITFMVLMLVVDDLGRLYLMFDNTSELFLLFNQCRDILLIVLFAECIRSLIRPRESMFDLNDDSTDDAETKGA